MFWWKSGILISDLYPYNIEIQTNIKKKNMLENQKNFKRIFDFFLAGPDSAQKENLLSTKLDSAQSCGLHY
jgi:hypothetical protein